MRLDKYLKVSRLIKRRTVANEACDAGRAVSYTHLDVYKRQTSGKSLEWTQKWKRRKWKNVSCN